MAQCLHDRESVPLSKLWQFIDGLCDRVRETDHHQLGLGASTFSLKQVCTRLVGDVQNMTANSLQVVCYYPMRTTPLGNPMQPCTVELSFQSCLAGPSFMHTRPIVFGPRQDERRSQRPCLTCTSMLPSSPFSMPGRERRRVEWNRRAITSPIRDRLSYAQPQQGPRSLPG